MTSVKVNERKGERVEEEDNILRVQLGPNSLIEDIHPDHAAKYLYTALTVNTKFVKNSAKTINDNDDWVVKLFNLFPDLLGHFDPDFVSKFLKSKFLRPSNCLC